jgi:uncharacterized GH25 family protein
MNFKRSIIWIALLLIAVCWTIPANAHTVWIEAKEYNLDVGKKLYAFLGWGHYLPVADVVGTQWIDEFTIHEPDGNKIVKKYTDDQKGFMPTPFSLEKEGTYRLTAELIPGYYTPYKKEDDDHVHHHFGPKTTIPGEYSEVVISLSYEQYSKCIITSGSKNGTATKPVGQRMEIMLDKDPTEYRAANTTWQKMKGFFCDNFPSIGYKLFPEGAGDILNFVVLWEGKPLPHKGVFYAMPLGDSPYFDDYTYNRIPLINGQGGFRITRPGIWHIKTAYKLDPTDEMTEKCDMMTYTATLTFQVDVEGDFPKPGYFF